MKRHRLRLLEAHLSQHAGKGTIAHARARLSEWTGLLTLVAVLVVAGAPRTLRAQFCADTDPCAPPTVSIQAATSVSVASLPLTIYASEDGTLNLATWKLWYDGVDQSTWIGTSGVISNPGNSYNALSATGLFTLSSGTKALVTEICEAAAQPQCSRDTLWVTYTPPPPPPSRAAPVVTLAQRNDARLLDGCATCASYTTAYSTPTFVFNGAEQAATLRYSTELAKPTGYVEADVKVNASTIPSKLRLRLRRSNGSYVTLSTTTTESYVSGDTARVRMAAQYDASADPTGAYTYDLLVTAYYVSPADSMTTTVSGVRVLIHNETASPYGIGWTVAGVTRIHKQTDGSLVLTDGAGGIAYLALGSCGGSPWSCAYTEPAGDFSTVVRKVKSATDTVWTRTGRDGTVTEWANTGLQRSVTDRWGNVASVERMTSGDVSRIHRIRLETELQSTTISKYITFAYDGTTGKLSGITLPDGRQSLVTVLAGTYGALTTISDPDGVTALSAGYASSRIVRQSGRNAASDSIHYDSLGQMARYTSAPVTIDSGYSAKNVTEIVSLRHALLSGLAGTASGSTVAAIRTDSAYLKVTNARGTVTRTWSALGGALAKRRIRTASGQVDTASVGYNANHQPISAGGTGMAGQVLEWSGALLTSTVDVGTGLRTDYSYIGSYDQLDSIVVAGKRMLKHYYSGAMLAADSTRSDSAAITAYTRDARGRIVSTRTPAYVTLTTTYESTHANPSVVTRLGYGWTTSTTYDAGGHPLTVTDPSGRTFTTRRDALNRDTLQQGPLSSSTRYRYNDVAGVDSVIDPVGQVYAVRRNAAGWVTSQVDPRGMRDSIQYDRLGRPTRVIGRRGEVITNTYDGLDRVLVRTDSLPGQAKNTTTFSYDPSKRWVAVQNAESIDTMFVDAGGRAVRAATVRAGKHFEFRYGYTQFDLVDGITVQRDSAGAVLWTATTGAGYDAVRRANQVLGYDNKLTTTLFDRMGRPLRDTLPTSTTASVKVRKATSYTSAGFPQAETYANVGGAGPVPDRTYGAWDELARLGTIVRPTETTPITRSHSYDQLGRLASWADVQQQVTGWTYNWQEDPWGDCPGCWILVDSMPVYQNVTLESAAYTYDLVGNRTGAGITLTTGNRMTAFDGWTITYDDGGNITSRRKGADTLTYGWDALGQLVQVTSTAPAYTVTYGYDGFGRRVRKTVNGVATRYLVEGDRVLVELDNSWAVAAKYSYYPGVDRPHSMVRNGTTYYYTMDQQGNVTGLLNASGAVVQTYSYTPYGTAQSSYGNIVNPYRYKGREWDEEARLPYMRARYYDPMLGRFISEDPIGLAGGINPTAFVGSDPVLGRDPSGLKECDPLIEGRWGYHTTIQGGEARCVRDFEYAAGAAPIIVTARRIDSFGMPSGPDDMPDLSDYRWWRGSSASMPALAAPTLGISTKVPSDALRTMDPSIARARALCRQTMYVSHASAGFFGGQAIGATVGLVSAARSAQAYGVAVGVVGGVFLGPEAAAPAYRFGRLLGIGAEASKGMWIGRGVGAATGVIAGGVAGQTSCP